MHWLIICNDPALSCAFSNGVWSVAYWVGVGWIDTNFVEQRRHCIGVYSGSWYGYGVSGIMA
jgi:hypothetical protein